MINFEQTWFLIQFAYVARMGERIFCEAMTASENAKPRHPDATTNFRVASTHHQTPKALRALTRGELFACKNNPSSD